MNRLVERIGLAVVWHLPRRTPAVRTAGAFVYWCAIRLWAYGTTGVYSSTDATALKMDEALARWRT